MPAANRLHQTWMPVESGAGQPANEVPGKPVPITWVRAETLKRWPGEWVLSGRRDDTLSGWIHRRVPVIGLVHADSHGRADARLREP